MIHLRLNYFALLREQRGCSDESITTEFTTALELYHDLQEKYQLSLPVDILRVAVNNEFVGWDYQLKDNDEITFIPPVSGG